MKLSAVMTLSRFENLSPKVRRFQDFGVPYQLCRSLTSWSTASSHPCAFATRDVAHHDTSISALYNSTYSRNVRQKFLRGDGHAFSDSSPFECRGEISWWIEETQCQQMLPMGRCSTTRSAWAMGYLYPISIPPLSRRIFPPLPISGAPVITVKSRRATPGSSLSHACRDAGPGARGASGRGARRLPAIHGGALRNQFLHSNSCTLSVKIMAPRLSFSTNNCSSQSGTSNSATPAQARWKGTGRAKCILAQAHYIMMVPTSSTR